ncbi:MAG: succinate dehydrogenase iron-sulfur subunit [Candidatus Thiodiazotropha sp. (ex Lucinoma aequizonata)]|nr:succinate dehydrogenase iron-sulfur subunit [Candidatus Thiodiazotropha sp. (ex Lucinoma aequizonata)]MCU7888003.1 succinate dehydrogenase iron-sulfur subunit [Candidatus Thiodiazotropha sp. (ex Lucinoma aequizonata)]MCU7895962.1 succinate dehydrogenase iron-sulfur subunit [Candidatus Thiodiazotropha sp. (ex Lucinoma aequizonata)]MCU7899191.1 succinate dehydrogenase iron-sulfur subunit [Candidatus Thiodiazotropha sp. (ex Lucinoma aequizonata)]MCU7902036.1 succinate dehydrogenase iron-sulfur 
MKFSIYRYNPETDSEPYMQTFEIEYRQGMMLRDALLAIQEQDESFTFRHSCGEGVCGSDGVNVNGSNKLACITPLTELKDPVEVRPFPGRPVIRDLVVDMSQFYAQYKQVDPWLQCKEPLPEQEILQTLEERDQLDGLYECIMCGCCSTACPSFWWNPDKFLGPQALLSACRFLADSRDQAGEERLDKLEGPYKLFRCHTIMNCVEACPKGLNPTKAIGHIKAIMLKEAI